MSYVSYLEPIFLQSIVCICDIHFKNRETTFFKRTNLLVISELMYRMKDNARTFFIVTIISAVSFTAIGVCTAIANPELAKHETPYAFTYQSDKGIH